MSDWSWLNQNKRKSIFTTSEDDDWQAEEARRQQEEYDEQQRQWEEEQQRQREEEIERAIHRANIITETKLHPRRAAILFPTAKLELMKLDRRFRP